MQEPLPDHDESCLISSELDVHEDCELGDEFEYPIEESSQQTKDETESPSVEQAANQPCDELEQDIDDPDRTRDFDLSSFVECLSRGLARYNRGDPDCETDYRNAFFIDSGLAAREMVQQLEVELHRDVVYVLLGCRRRLRFNPQDLIARTRLGLALLILHQETAAFHELQQVFSQGPVWRPFLRLLVNQTKPRRSIVHSRLLWNSGRICPSCGPCLWPSAGSAVAGGHFKRPIPIHRL